MSRSQRILEEIKDNENDMNTKSLPVSTSPVTSTRTVKNASRPSRLFRTTSWSPSVMDTDAPLDKFAASIEFAQLMTLPIKCHENSENALGKENEDAGYHSRKHSLADGEDFKECGDGFKRPIPPKDPSTPLQSKRAKSGLQGQWNGSPTNMLASLHVGDHSALATQTSLPSSPKKEIGNILNNARLYMRSQSDSAVKHAVEISSTDPLLVGDCSKRYLLPVKSDGKHDDLKEIESDTVADLINGKYASQINSFTIIDCRYPYEFQGGHIKGAVNLYTQQQVNAQFMENKTSKAMGESELERNIIIFHCEFSSRRAPNLCRYLRSADRLNNATVFPALHYPELYILYGGYKNFFQSYEAFCEPQYYRTMLDENHKDDLKLYKSKSVSELVASKPKSMSRFPRFASGTAMKQPKF